MKHNYLKSLFLMLMMCVGMSAWAEDKTTTFTSFGNNSTSGNKEGVSYTTAIGSNSNGQAPQMSSTQLRLYTGNTMTISTETGILKSITFTTNSTATYGGGVFTYNGNKIASSNSTTVKWDCANYNASEIVLVASDNARLTGITVVTGTNEVKQKYTVTIVTPENGSLTIKDGSTTINNGDEVEEGKTLTVEVAPTNGYRFKTWGYKDGDANWVGNVTSTFTHVMPSAPCSFKATFEEIPTYTVAFSVNGTIVNSDRLQEGAAVTVPTVKDINGKVFVGWVKTPTVDAETAPKYETISKATETVTYYAVFADFQQGDAQIITDELTQKWTGSTSTTYADWSNKTLSSGAVYAGKTAGNNESIQLRNNSTGKNPTYDGIITTKSGGKAKKVSVEWNSSTTSGRTLNVYGKNQAYSAVKDVFDESKYGTLIGKIVYGTSTTLSIDGDYDFIALASNSGAMYLKSISIDWENGTSDVYSDFTTTPSPAEPTSTTITISSVLYSTYYDSKHSYVMPDDCEGYVFTAANGLQLAYEAKKVVPAGEPLVIYTIEPGTKTLNYTTSTDDTWKSINMNDLEGTDEATALEADDNYYFYGLSKGKTGTEYDGKVGFFWMAEGGAAFTNGAHKAYLKLPKTQSSAKAFAFDDVETLISEINAETTANKQVYDLQGRKVTTAKKGLYIINGKKVIK